MKKRKERKAGKRIEISKKELKVNLEQLQKDVVKAYDSMKMMVPHAVKNVEVKPFGNAAHIILPREFAGKKAVVFIKRDWKETKNAKRNGWIHKI